MSLIHGTMMRIHQTGVLITGAPGSGKSELALELLDRGHQLVSDDAVEIEAQDTDLVAYSPEKIYGKLFCYAFGLFDILVIHGNQAICKQSSLDFIIHLTQEAIKLPAQLTGHLSEQFLINQYYPLLTLSVSNPRSRPLALLIDHYIRQWQHHKKFQSTNS